MGTLAHLAPISGLLAGIIIAKLVPYELKQGEKYFRLLQYALGIAVVGTAVWQKIKMQPINVDVALFLFLLVAGTRYHQSFTVFLKRQK